MPATVDCAAACEATCTAAKPGPSRGASPSKARMRPDFAATMPS